MRFNLQKRLFTLAAIGLLLANNSSDLLHAQGRAHSHGASFGDVPAYNAAPPRPNSNLRPIMTGPALATFEYPFQVAAYKIAAKIHETLYQLPCYCYCDRGHGHNSLRSCFEDDHGARCHACMAEVFYAYQEMKKGKGAREIREGIKRGEWQQVDLRQAAAAYEADQAAKKQAPAKKAAPPSKNN